MPRKKSGKHKVFILNIGYVEDGLNSSLIVSHAHGFDTVEAALADFGKAFVEANQEQEEPGTCCAGQTGRFCAECGRSLDRHGVGRDELEDWIRAFAIADADGGGEVFDILYHRGWEFGIGDTNPFTKGFVYVSSCAESIIAGLLVSEEDGGRKDYRSDPKDKVKVF